MVFNKVLKRKIFQPAYFAIRSHPTYEYSIGVRIKYMALTMAASAVMSYTWFEGNWGLQAAPEQEF